MITSSFRDDRLLPLLRRLFWLRGVYATAEYVRAVTWRVPRLRPLTIPPELAALDQLPGPTQASSAATGTRLLFFSPRGHVSMFYEGLIASAARARGADVHVVTCGGDLPICSFATVEVTPPLPCTFCRDYGKNVLNAWNLPSSELRHYRREGDRDSAVYAAMRPHELSDVSYRGVPIGRLVRCGAAAFMRDDELSGGEGRLVHQRFLEGARPMVDACIGVLETTRPDRVFMTNGLFFPDAIMLHLCLERHIPILTYEWGHRPNSLVFAWNQPAGFFEHEDGWLARRDIALSQAEEERIEQYLLDRRTGEKHAGAVYPHKSTLDVEEVRTGLRLDPQKPLVTLFTNLVWDSAVFERNASFGGLREWLLETIDIFEGWPDVQLAIRIHPAEVRVPFMQTHSRLVDFLARAGPRLPTNVRIVAPESAISSYSLASISAATVVYASTIGLELAAMGKPVVVAGRVHYANRGFTRDITSRENYAATLRQAVEEAHMDADRVAVAQRYAYFFFFQIMRSFPLVDLVDGSTMGNIRVDGHRLHAGTTGDDPAVAEICDALMSGGDILGPIPTLEGR